MIHKDTIIIKNAVENLSGLERAAAVLKNGGLVVFPTETVYGLGASAFNKEAVESIFIAKDRPADNPLIVHINGINELELIAKDIPEEALLLFKAFSPGPLTIILPRKESLPANVTAGLNTVAVRIPVHPVARKLIEMSGLPLAAPSANRSGKPSPTGFEMAVKDMIGRVDVIIDGGDCDIGLESTVVMIENHTIEIVRPGSITKEMITEKLKQYKNIKVKVTGNKSLKEKPISPGLKYSHYKPKADVYLTKNIKITLIKTKFPEKRVGILYMKSAGKIPKNMESKKFKTLSDYAKGLYKSFAEFDIKGINIIIAQKVDEKGIGTAIMNRLNKASGGGKEI